MARIGALIAILGVTVLPFVSCEMAGVSVISLKGHELMLDSPPDGKDLGEDLLRRMGMDETMSPTPDPGTGAEPEVKITPTGSDRKMETLYKGNRWVQFLLIGVFLLAVIGLIVGRGRGLLVTLGIAGILGVVFFIDRFNAGITDQMGKDSSAEKPKFSVTVFDYDLGAYLTMLGFGLMAVGGYVQEQNRGRNSSVFD